MTISRGGSVARIGLIILFFVTLSCIIGGLVSITSLCGGLFLIRKFASDVSVRFPLIMDYDAFVKFDDEGAYLYRNPPPTIAKKDAYYHDLHHRLVTGAPIYRKPTLENVDNLVFRSAGQAPNFAVAWLDLDRNMTSLDEEFSWGADVGKSMQLIRGYKFVAVSMAFKVNRFTLNSALISAHLTVYNKVGEKVNQAAASTLLPRAVIAQKRVCSMISTTMHIVSIGSPMRETTDRLVDRLVYRGWCRRWVPVSIPVVHRLGVKNAKLIKVLTHPGVFLSEPSLIIAPVLSSWREFLREWRVTIASVMAIITGVCSSLFSFLILVLLYSRQIALP